MSDKDEPERAELISMEINVVDGRPHVEMEIEYIAPRHLDHAPLIFRRVKDELETILKKKPNDALRRIERPWPFHLTVKSWLSGHPLDTTMDFAGQ